MQVVEVYLVLAVEVGPPKGTAKNELDAVLDLAGTLDILLLETEHFQRGTIRRNSLRGVDERTRLVVHQRVRSLLSRRDHLAREAGSHEVRADLGVGGPIAEIGNLLQVVEHGEQTGQPLALL